MIFTPKMGRAYNKLPPHHSFAELANNIERLAGELMYQSLGRLAHKDFENAPNRWEWKLGKDLKLLIEYARRHVPPDVDELHHFEERGGRSLRL
jgi:hypothetical protein